MDMCCHPQQIIILVILINRYKKNVLRVEFGSNGFPEKRILIGSLIFVAL
jgi:hypothetical protein